jgi:serine/threonine-protein kinase
MRSDACVGDVVDGRYLLLKRAGCGASGTVWMARDLRTAIDVAVKVLRADHLASATILAHFEREAELASRMLSPHIVRVLARGLTTDQGPYVVYEHLEGEDLGRLLTRRGRLSIAETRTVLVHCCRALARAHALGVLHRDIKPSNLFLADGADGQLVVKVLDFGLADVVRRDRSDEHRDPNALAGTLEYMAPEVLFGESAPEAPSDLYALAVVAYECLTGCVPYAAESIATLVAAYARGAARAPTTTRRGLTPEVDAWFARALAREPAHRFASAQAMADAFEEAMESFERAPLASFCVEPGKTSQVMCKPSIEHVAASRRRPA